MSQLIGNIGSDGVTITLTTGSVPSYIRADSTAQVYGYVGSVLKTFSATTIASIGSGGSSFVLNNAANANTNGVSFTICQPYAGMNSAWQQNCAVIPALSGTTSSTAGYFGSDGGQSIDLAQAGISDVLWLQGDTMWATAAGQSRSQTAFPRSVIAIQSGGNYTLNYTGTGPATPAVGSDTLTFYNGGTATNPTQFIQTYWPAHYNWLFTALTLNQYSSYIFCLENIGGNSQVWSNKVVIYWINNISNGSSLTAPSSWNLQSIASPFSEALPCVVAGMIFDGAQYVYGNAYPGSSNNTVPRFNVYAFRIPYADIHVGAGGTPTFEGIQYWCGANGWQQNPDANLLKSIYTCGLGAAGIWKKSNGTYVTTNTVVYGGGSFAYLTSPSLSSPNWSAQKIFYTYPIPNGSGITVYSEELHPEQIWPGQGTDDIIFSHSVNSPNYATDTSTYWIKFYQLTGI